MTIKQEKKLIEEQGVLIKDEVYALKSKLDGTTYAYHCNICGGSRKVYQNPYHHKDCPNTGKDI